MIIAVDFDGTIVDHKFPEIGPIKSQAFETLKRWQAAGDKIILWTCRNHSELYDGRDLLTEAIAFCEANGFEFDAINCNVAELSFNPVPKIYADWYIDDRANDEYVAWGYLQSIYNDKQKRMAHGL